MYILDETGTLDWGKQTTVKIGTDASVGESEVPLLLGTARGHKAGGGGGEGKKKTDEDGHSDGGGLYDMRNVHWGKKKANTHDAAV